MPLVSILLQQTPIAKKLLFAQQQSLCELNINKFISE